MSRTNSEQVLRPVADRQHMGCLAAAGNLVGAFQRESIDQRVGLFGIVRVDDIDVAVGLEDSVRRNRTSQEEQSPHRRADGDFSHTVLWDPRVGIFVDLEWHRAIVHDDPFPALPIVRLGGRLPPIGYSLPEIDCHLCARLDLPDAQPGECPRRIPINGRDADGASFEVRHVPFPFLKRVVARSVCLAESVAGLVVQEHQEVLISSTFPAIMSADREPDLLDGQHEGRRADAAGLCFAPDKGGQVWLGGPIGTIAVEQSPCLSGNGSALRGVETRAPINDSFRSDWQVGSEQGGRQHERSPDTDDLETHHLLFRGIRCLLKSKPAQLPCSTANLQNIASAINEPPASLVSKPVGLPYDSPQHAKTRDPPHSGRQQTKHAIQRRRQEAEIPGVVYSRHCRFCRPVLHCRRCDVLSELIPVTTNSVRPAS